VCKFVRPERLLENPRFWPQHCLVALYSNHPFLRPVVPSGLPCKSPRASPVKAFETHKWSWTQGGEEVNRVIGKSPKGHRIKLTG
jgi:hypothetical protein